MLRATTDLMVNVFCVLAGLAGLLAIWKGGLSGMVKIAVAIVAVVAIALLKTFDAKFWGVVVMGGAVIILFFLPWLDHSPVKSIRYRPTWHKYVYARVRGRLPGPRLPRHRSRRRRPARP